MIDLIVYFFALNSQQKLSMYFPKRVPEETFFPMRGKTFDNIVMLHEIFSLNNIYPFLCEVK